MTKSLNKRRLAVILICVTVLLLGGVVGYYAIFGSNADQADSKKEVLMEYTDYEYGSEPSIDIEDENVQGILNCYENSKLDLTVNNDNSISYLPDSVMKDQISSVEATISVKRSFTTDADQQESTILYLGSTSNCSINKETGSIEGAYEFETLLLNKEQPLAAYKLDSDENENIYITPAYVNEDDNPSMLLVSISKDKKVEVKGIYITKDDKGEALEQPQIQPIENGTLIYPAYENYVAKKAAIDQHYINAEELYDEEKAYTYGNDFDLTYGTLPNGSYLYNYKIQFGESNPDSENPDAQYCLYTDQKELEITDSKVTNVKDVDFEDINVDDYKLMKIGQYFKTVLKHAKNVPNADRFQIQCHLPIAEHGLKGYINTFNSFAINAAMRTDKTDTLDEDDKKTCDVLLKHCLNNQFDEKVLVVRNVSPGFLSQQFGVTLDGQELTDKLIKKSGDEACLKLEKDFQEAMIGKKILDKGFTSVSLVPHANVFNTRTIQFSIMVPAGTKAYVTNNLIESEAILAPGTSLNIKDVTYDTRKNKFIIYCMAEQNF